MTLCTVGSVLDNGQHERLDGLYIRSAKHLRSAPHDSKRARGKGSHQDEPEAPVLGGLVDL